MRRGVLPVVGRRIADVVCPPCNLRPISIVPPFPALRSKLIQRVVQNVGRLGKRILLELDDDSVVVIEPRMTGLVLLAHPPSPEHLRLKISFEPTALAPAELLFWDRRGLGTVRWLAADQIQDALGTHRIGPDALAIDSSLLQSRFAGSKRAIKVALLDQRAVAGIGNLYASEILFLAGIDPRTRCDSLRRGQWERIHKATIRILEMAIRYEGSTLSDGTYRNALNDPGGYQNHHQVYDLAGKICARCNHGTIERIVQVGRSTFFCAHCQQRRGCHPSAKNSLLEF